MKRRRMPKGRGRARSPQRRPTALSAGFAVKALLHHDVLEFAVATAACSYATSYSDK